MNTNCPHCHTPINIETAVEDDSARQLFGVLSKEITPAMVAYLGLFKPRKQSLRWSRAYLLANTALALCEDRTLLNHAMIETVESMRERRQRPDWKPLTTHNYLSSVITTLSARDPGQHSTAVKSPLTGQSKIAQSKTSQSIEILKTLTPPDSVDAWFARVVCDAHIDMLLLGLDNTPASDVMELAATRFIKELWPRREWSENSRELGANKVRKSIVTEAERNRRWPTPKSVLEHIPR